MLAKLSGLVVAAAVTLVACAPETPYRSTAEAVAAKSITGPVSRAELFTRTAVPGRTALLDVQERSSYLRGYFGGRGGGRIGDKLCARPKDLVDYSGLVAPSLAALKDGDNGNKAARDLSRAINASAAHLLISGDPVEAALAVRTLRTHADANAWIPAAPSWSTASAIIEAMGPLMPAWQILRQASTTTDADAAAIEAWFLRLATVADKHPGENSIGSYRGANDMMLGLMTGDAARYARGKRQGFVAQIAGMRTDGSFPLEVDRGLTALSNQSRNVGLLVYSAEIAASQGDNLYTATIGGGTLRDSIGFLIAADADNALVDQYAQANRNPSKNHPVFAPMSQVTPWDNSARAWIKIWTQRNPGDAFTQSLREKVKRGSRIQADVMGGNITCFVGK